MEQFIDKLYECMCEEVGVTITVDGNGFGSSYVESEIDSIVEKDSMLQINFKGNDTSLDINTNIIHDFKECNEDYMFLINDVKFCFSLN